jgi:hypothetical protein
MYELCAEIPGYRLILRVETPHIVKYRKSLLPESFVVRIHCWQQGVILKNLKDFLCLKKNIEAKINHACTALLIKKICRSVKNMGCLRLNFLLSAVIETGQSIFRYFKYK